MASRGDNAWLASAERATAVATSDSSTIPAPRFLWVGGGGAVKVTLDGQNDSQAVTFSGVPAGTMLPVQPKKVWATGTTATLIIAVY